MALARKTLGLRKNLREEERRDQIKEAAIKLFSSGGYEQVSLDDLAQAAGVSKALLYWYWESKGALLRDLIDTCMLSYLKLLQTTVDSDATYMEKMQHLLLDSLNLFRENEKLNKVVHLCSLHTGKKPEEDFGARVNEYYNKCMRLLESLFQEGMEHGFIKNNLDVEAMSLETMCFIEGYIYMSILGNRMALDRVLVPLFNTFIFGNGSTGT